MQYDAICHASMNGILEIFFIKMSQKLHKLSMCGDDFFSPWNNVLSQGEVILSQGNGLLF